MNRISFRFASLVLTSLCVFAGCDGSTGDAGIVGGKAYPKIGSNVDVQLRRDMLGIASEKPAGAMGENAPSTVATSGILKGITNEFVILQVHNDANRQIWVPRDAILLMDVKLPSEQTAQ